MDGINGLASGFIGLWILLLSLITLNKSNEIMFIFSILVLLNTYYIYRGYYFLGDAGTLFFGYFISIYTIYCYNFNLENKVFFSIEQIFIFFMIPGIDMFRLFIVRILNKKNPFARDLNHLHHLLIKFYSLRKVLLIYLFLFLVTNILSFYNFIDPIVIILIYVFIYILFIFYSKKHFVRSSK